MAEQHLLFPAHDCYTEREPAACGFYDLTLPDAFRWMAQEATLFLPSHEAQSYSRPALVILANAHGFSWIPYLSVYLNQRYLDTQTIAHYGVYYFEIPPGDEALAGPLEITFKVNHREQVPLSTGMEWVSLPLYSVQLLDLAREFPERHIVNEQLSVFDPQHYPLRAALAQLNEESTILDFGAGIGWSTFLLAAFSGARVTAVDLHPYDRTRGRGFKEELVSRLARHLTVFAATPGFERIRERADIERIVYERCSFYSMDIQQTLLRESLFDFAFSLNALEHVPDPGQTLREVARLLRPGGEFLGIFHIPYYSDGGSHLNACGLIDKPWAQLLLSRDEIRRMVIESGRVPNEIDHILDSLNGWRIQQYRDAVSQSGLQVLSQEYKKGFTVPGSEHSPEFKQVQKMYPIEDLITCGVMLHLRKD